MYGDFGTLTCAGYPGSINHLQKDAQTFANWGVDYIKLDGCYANQDDMEDGIFLLPIIFIILPDYF